MAIFQRAKRAARAQRGSLLRAVAWFRNCRIDDGKQRRYEFPAWLKYREKRLRCQKSERKRVATASVKIIIFRKYTRGISGKKLNAEKKNNDMRHTDRVYRCIHYIYLMQWRCVMIMNFGSGFSSIVNFPDVCPRLLRYSPVFRIKKNKNFQYIAILYIFSDPIRVL